MLDTNTETIAIAAAVLILAAPAAAQPSADVPMEYRTVRCANAVLEALVASDRNPSVPIYDRGAAVWFLGCAPSPGPVVMPILNAARGDIESVHRYAEALGDINWYIRHATCNAWLAIYTNEYQWTLAEYGSDGMVDLPTPAERVDDCERWIGTMRGGE